MNNHAVAEAVDEDSLQVLTFILDQEIFGANINHVQEVLEFTGVTRVPKMPDYMIGVINLRGNVVAVVDLCRQFDMHQQEHTVDTCIVIVEVMIENQLTSLGLLADAVREVLVLEREHISAPPRIGISVDTRYLCGMGKHGDNFIILLDLAKLFNLEELEYIGQAQDGGVASDHTT